MISQAVLGVELQNGGGTGSNVRIKTYSTGERDEIWEPVNGERDKIRDNYGILIIELEDAESGYDTHQKRNGNGIGKLCFVKSPSPPKMLGTTKRRTTIPRRKTNTCSRGSGTALFQ